MSKRRVVVTGLGLVSPLGHDLETVWQKLLDGQSGIRMISDFDTSEFATRFAGTVQDFDISQFMSVKEARKCDPFIQYGIAAAHQAVVHAGLDQPSAALLPPRIGVIMGSGIGGLGTIETTHALLSTQGPKRVSPFFIPASIVNMISGHISIRFGFQGPNLAVATACTTGTHSIGMAARLIAYGDADAMVAGGAEKASTPLGLAGFAAARALSARNEDPEGASRPWDRDRDGFVLGDGAAALVLEEYDIARRRGANILAEITGFGMSGDAFHITRPPEGGDGARRSMQAALNDAQCPAEAIDYINAHATSTDAGDIEELMAIQKLLGPQASKVAISSTKSMTGHLLGAAGALEAVFSILTLRDQKVPPTRNLENLDPKCDFGLDLVPHHARDKAITTVLSNSFGFGGTNGTLIFKKIK